MRLATDLVNLYIILVSVRYLDGRDSESAPSKEAFDDFNYNNCRWTYLPIRYSETATTVGSSTPAY